MDKFDQRLTELSERVLSTTLADEEKNNYTETLFESIKHINEHGEEFWYARELSKVLEYKDFRNFELAIFKAMDACKNSENEILDHFGEVTEMVNKEKPPLRQQERLYIDNCTQSKDCE